MILTQKCLFFFSLVTSGAKSIFTRFFKSTDFLDKDASRWMAILVTKVTLKILKCINNVAKRGAKVIQDYNNIRPKSETKNDSFSFYRGQNHLIFP